jgi:glycosyltransferase involved in cell wall biosynthesis
VGYASGAVAELVLPDGGEIVEQDCVDQLAEALQRWLSDPAKLAAGRIAARGRAEQFDIHKLAEQLWNEYQGLRNGLL